jgi:hypothetical protein
MAPIEWSSWALVAIGALTLLAIWKQVRESVKATQSMCESVKLQETALRQWVDIASWSIRREIREDGRKMLYIAFDIVNHTKLPVTLESVTISVGGDRLDSKAKNALNPDNNFRVDTFILLSEDQDAHYLGNRLILPVRGDVAFIDVLTKCRHHPFGGLLVCNRQGVEFVHQETMVPEAPMLKPPSEVRP